jgi:hypothetical protein
MAIFFDSDPQMATPPPAHSIRAESAAPQDIVITKTMRVWSACVSVLVCVCVCVCVCVPSSHTISRESVCCLLVLDSVTSTPQWIRQPKPRESERIGVIKAFDKKS